jgi:hypothetical protein
VASGTQLLDLVSRNLLCTICPDRIVVALQPDLLSTDQSELRFASMDAGPESTPRLWISYHPDRFAGGGLGAD